MMRESDDSNAFRMMLTDVSKSLRKDIDVADSS